MEATSPYKVVFTVPSGWTNADSVNVTVSINYLTGLAIEKLEYHMDGDWTDLTSKLSSGRTTIQVAENGTLTVRLTDPHGHVFTDETEINCFDMTAPAVNAGINGDELKIRATDTQSGVAGVQVNGLLFTTIDEGEISITVKDVLSKYEHLAVRAFDYAGNFSELVTIDNPYYEAPATSTPSPTGTPKTAATTSTADASASTAAVVTSTATANISAAVNGNSVVYVPEWTAAAVTATPAPVATPTPQVIYETVT